MKFHVLGASIFAYIFYIDFGMHLVAVWLTFGSLLAPFRSPWHPFGSHWLPFVSLWLPLAPFWQPSAHFLLSLGAASLHFASWHRFGVLLVHFGSPFGPSWGSNGNQNAAKAAQVVPKGSKNNHLDRLDFCEHSVIFVLSFLGSRVDSGCHLGPQIPGSFAYVNEIYSSIVSYSILSLTLYRCWP